MKGVSRLLPPFLLIAVSVGVEGGCPHNAGKRAMECIGSMGDLGFGMKDDMVRPWDYQRTKMACDNHAFDLAIDCANSIVSECSENELGFLMNIPKMRRAVVKMCDSVDEMRPYVRCMHAQLDVVRRCAHEQKSILHAKIRAAGGDRQKKMKSLCSFTNNVYGCQAAPVRQHCGRRPAKFLLHFMNAFRPPSCPAPDGVSDIAPQFRISNGLILVCLLTSFLSCLYTRR